MAIGEYFIEHARRIRYEYWLTTLFFICEIIIIHFHELWRDEMQAWLIAVHSTSLVNLVHNTRYETTPILWHVLLFCISRFTANPIAMQLLSVVIATASVYLIARYSPFNKIQKFLLAFGYFSFYEYGIIARGYGLGVFFIFLLCVLLLAKRKNYIAIGIVLFLLAQSNPVAVLLVPTLILYMVWNFLSSTKNKTRNWTPVIIAILISFAGLALYLVQLRPQFDEITPIGSNAPSIKYALATVWYSYIPIPQIVVSFWNSNFVTSINELVPLAITLIVSAVAFFYKNIKILAVYLFGTAIMIGFFDIKYFGSLWHWGYLYILFITCAWLLFKEHKRQKASKRLKLYQQAIIYLLVSLQFIAGGIAVYKDCKYPFSDSKTAASYIESAKLENLPIVGVLDSNTESILGYINKTAYYPQSGSWGSFVIWNVRRLQPITFGQEISDTVNIAHNKRSNVLVISPQQLNTSQEKRIIFIAKFNQPAIVSNEVYFLYLVPNR
jgi:hypothetical protein